MSIKQVLISALTALGVMLMCALTFVMLLEWQSFRTSQKIEAANEVMDRLMTSAGDLALERGTTQAALNAPQPADAATREKIASLRQQSDMALAEAWRGLKPAGLSDDRGVVASVDAAMVRVKAMREKVDAEIARPAAGRDPALRAQWFPTVSNLIDVSQQGRIYFNGQMLNLGSALALDVVIRHNLWLITEYTGRERGLLAGRIAAAQPLSPADIKTLNENRSRVEEGWNVISHLALPANEVAAFAPHFDAIKSSLFGTYQTMRAQAYQQGADGHYSMTSQQWMAEATRAIDAVQALQGVERDDIAATAAQDMKSHGQKLLLSLAASLAGIMLLAWAFWIISRKVMRNISVMTDVMTELAKERHDLPVPFKEANGELGAMARALVVLQQTCRDKIHLQGEQARILAEGEAEKLKARLELASNFEARVSGIIHTVAAASTELSMTAENMMSIVDRAGQRAVSVREVTVQSTENLQEVATATTELAKSVDEISRQVGITSGAIKTVVTEIDRADRVATELGQMTQRIGSITDVIQGITSQINLLALNATIEAARAGEAGKGFAVVASEVKALAGATHRSATEINAVILDIQNVAGSVARALSAVQTAVAKVDENALVISSAVEQQSAANTQIAANIQKSAAGALTIESDIGTVTEATTTAVASAQQTLMAAQSLSVDAENLSKEVSRFFNELTQAA